MIQTLRHIGAHLVVCQHYLVLQGKVSLVACLRVGIQHYDVLLRAHGYKVGYVVVQLVHLNGLVVERYLARGIDVEGKCVLLVHLRLHVVGILVVVERG